MKNSPVSVVKEQFQSKEKLVEAVQKLATSDLWLDRVSSSKGLGRVSNQKLLRLHALLSDIKSRFGNRGKLIGSILELEKRAKDAGYQKRLEGYSLPRLADLHGVLDRKRVRAEAKAKAAPKKAPAKAAAKKAPAKAAVKKAPAKKAPAKKS
ncbi:MAG TPA: hypothetical protein VG937_31515 [Polyangiaceae bacterium]|nr:hypothetical protein [Polyangiaceae bacterium]